jgi:hypothetical protein
VLITMPLEMPRLEPDVEKVPELLVAPPIVRVGAPVKVMPLLPAAIVLARVVALVVLVTVTVAAAGRARLRVARTTTSNCIRKEVTRFLPFAMAVCNSKLFTSTQPTLAQVCGCHRLG